MPFNNNNKYFIYQGGLAGRLEKLTFVGEGVSKMIIAVINTTWEAVKIKPEKHFDWCGRRTHDLCDTGALLYQLSLGVRDKLVKDK